MTFSVAKDTNGLVSVQAGWSNSRPTPAAIAGLYASIHTGQIVNDFRLGGMNEPFVPQPPPNHSLPCFSAPTRIESGVIYAHGVAVIFAALIILPSIRSPVPTVVAGRSRKNSAPLLSATMSPTWSRRLRPLCTNSQPVSSGRS